MAYATISDLREAGFGMDAEESRLAVLLDQASALIDEWTGQWFESREMTLKLDGSRTPSLELPVPPVRIDEVRVDGQVWPITLYTVVEDPEDPVLYCPSKWPPGKRNVEVRGAFGRLENGTTPKLITVACVRLAARLLQLDGDLDAGRRISQESENGTQVIYERDNRPALWSGDPEIDGIIVRFVRPPGVGVA